MLSTIKELAMKSTVAEIPSSSTPGNTVTSNTELLGRIHLTAADRNRAEAALLRGEALADLMISAGRTLKGWVEHHQQHATDPRHLKSAG